jgi:hypothetical protein
VFFFFPVSVGLVLHQTLLGQGHVWAAAALADAGPGTARAAPGDHHRTRGRVPVGVVFFVVVTYVPVAAQIPRYVRVSTTMWYIADTVKYFPAQGFVLADGPLNSACVYLFSFFPSFFLSPIHDSH